MNIFAPAKINLHLHVTGKNNNGFHFLDSLAAFADIGDQLAMEPADIFSFKIEGPFAASLADDGNNLVCRAAKLIAASLNRKPDVIITLQKNLPVASGIGGGSADAAATLWGLREYWHADITDRQLHKMALELGSDVPVCLKSQAFVMRGTGDVLSPAPELPELPIILVWPNIQLSTADVFKNRNAAEFSHNAVFQPSYDDIRLFTSDLAFETRNDLTATAVHLCPEIETTLQAVLPLDGCLLSRMSGSGSTIFGIFETLAHAQAAEQSLAANHPDWWVKSGWLNRVTRY